MTARMRGLTLAGFLLLGGIVGGCAAASQPLAPSEQREVKRQILLEHGAELTREQQSYIIYTPFRTREEADALLQRFLETNRQREAIRQAAAEDVSR